jgi:alkanesulfonate monooxygenase SsuD/methylene tetrahydromethanopterin reductase-like flavin-dependent oxidoreductase (luciferase family)
MSVEFSLLELASVRINETPCDSFTHAVAYAKAADALGFKRFWLAEHHNMQGIASSATAVLRGIRSSCAWVPAGLCCPTIRR